MENRDIRIAFFDIDGTLLPPDHHLPESTVAALNILRAKGVQLYLATGRPPYHLHYLKKDLPFEFDGMVMMNGQYCRDKDGCFYAHPLPQEGLRELLPWLEKTNIAVSFVEADTAYMNRTNALPAACKLAKKYKVEMPIVNAVDDILSGRLAARDALATMMGRQLKQE